jgi:hypothetical protein
MTQRLLAIGVIFTCTSVGWILLARTISWRTAEADGKLRDRVESVWGAPQVQMASAASYQGGSWRPVASDLDVALGLEYRRKGLLWYSTYTVAFQGVYEFRNENPEPRTVQLQWSFPAERAVYDNLQFLVNGAPAAPRWQSGGAVIPAEFAPGETIRLAVSYRSQGLDSWRYRFGDQVTSLPDFRLHAVTNFSAVDFADNTLAPTGKRAAGAGWDLEWNYRNLLSGYEIAIVMPEKVQPGPLAANISRFAPISLLFFFFLMVMITTLRGTELHPMNYFFLACSFFAFHLLLAYLVDHLNLYVAFASASAVSVGLVFSYLRIVMGPRFASREAAGAQFLYLVLFSFAFFFRGFTGLAITIGSILTLFAVMQMTARIRWGEKFLDPARPDVRQSLS